MQVKEEMEDVLGMCLFVLWNTRFSYCLDKSPSQVDFPDTPLHSSHTITFSAAEHNSYLLLKLIHQCIIYICLSRAGSPPKTKNVILVFTWHFFSYVCSDVQELTCVLSVSITDCLLWQRPADVIDHLLHLTSSSHLGVLMPELWLRKG